MKILCIAAHPDDEVLGCGATLARLSREGHSVQIAILGEGITSRSSDRAAADQTDVRTLHQKTRKVAKLLGARELFQYTFPDNRFDTVPLLEVVRTIEQLIGQTKPEVIYTHHGGDLNIDHAVAHRAVLTATRPLSGCPVQEIYAFEVPSSTEWGFQQFEPIFRPNVFVDIHDTLKVKIEAMRMYESEVRSLPHPRSPEILRAISQRWGSMAGVEYAEAFELIRLVRR
jgi:LmbE family N-acetylglucosaminyl deacetylase